MKKLLAFLVVVCCWLNVLADKKSEPVVVAYVTSWSRVMPDPTVMTHINYAFGHVNDQFNGVRIDNEQRLRDIVSLKKQQPKLRVMLSIGGWGSGRFSEMAASDENRMAFAKDCRRICDELGLDGIDIDWEYPTQKSAGISASPQDTENFTLLMRDLRKTLGSKLWLTLASVGSAQFIDFKSCVQYLNMVNVMAYDMGNAPKHHSALYRSKIVGWLCASDAVEAHRKAGVPDEKIVLGMPFYGRGKSGVYMKYRDRDKHTETEVWSNTSKAPFLKDENGELVIGFESPRSIAAKCAYIKQQGLRGAMYWEYADDNEQGDLQRAVWQGIMQGDKQRSTSCWRAAQRLAAVLKANQRREDVSPDSFFHDYRDLMSHIKREKDPTVQAIYRAAMAHMLCQNRWRSQGYGRKTSSHPDSIQEWSIQEYNDYAIKLYAQAMQDPDALHRCKVTNIKPLAVPGKDDAIFDGDLLYLIWQTFKDDCSARGRGLYPHYTDIIDVYRRHGQREAALLLRIDSLEEAPLQTFHREVILSDANHLSSGEKSREELLLRLRDEYIDLPACADVYMLLASLPDKTNQEKQDLLEEALRRYPKSRQANELKNRIAELRQPSLRTRFNEMCYPDKDYDIPLEIKNMQSGSIALYRLPIGFKFSDDDKAGTKLEQVRANGTLVETLPISMEGVEALETKKDTLKWHSPGFGCYAFVLDGTTQEKTLSNSPLKVENSGKKASSLRGGLEGSSSVVCQFDVSALTFMNVSMPDGKRRIMVTDAMSGEPQQGVKVVFYNRTQQEYTKLEEQTTDSRGIVEASFDDNKRNLYVELSRGEDKAFGKKSLGWRYYYDKDEDLHHRINVYTDRSIYRPGQTVYVGGFAYCWQHGEAPKAEERTDLKLTLIDANGQEIMEHTLKTDEFGSLTDSLQLPETGLPGSYHIRLDGWLHYFRVEEYRRPTFQVEMDEAPAITLPVDSITLTGKALTYSQWPVAGARVTGTYQWQQSWLWKRFNPSEAHDIDTLYTDEEGKFSITVPVSKELTKEDLRWGQTLQLSVDVLSTEGETQQGSIRVPLCSTPLRMSGNVPEQQNRESLRPWRFDLYSSNDKPVEGDVLCFLSQDGKEVKNFYIPANRDTIPDVLRSLPSGVYDLVAKAGGQWSSLRSGAGGTMVNGQWSAGDTASYKASFTIFSITDKRLIGKHDLWLYTPCDTISAEKPARFQIGTTLPDAWIYCIINGENGIVRDTLLHFSDQAMLVEVPYEERFQHHLAVSAFLIHEGNFEEERLHFRFEQPETRLTMRWDTFRDHLQPGQKEQWRLTLTRPDGTPASANVMVGMYDASLDALAPYEMRSRISFFTHCDRDIFFRVGYAGWYGRYRYTALHMSPYILPVEGYDFARWNEELFQGARLTRGTKTTMRVRGVGANRLEERVYEMVDPAPMAASAREYAGAVKNFKMDDVEGLAFESVDQALQGKIAGLDIVDSSGALGKGTTMRLRGYGDVEESEEAVETLDDAYVRSNLSELAFFYPQLRTDSKGQTSIEFTLPEGLTSWHLHGLAHTKDMMTAEWQETVVAKKELMAELTLPRFLRNGDEVSLTASIRNASETRQRGEAVLEVHDAESNKLLKKMKVSFDLEPGKEAVHQMPFKATPDHPVLAVRWKAVGKGSSDGEVRYLPVLSDMQNVSETRTYLLKGDTTLTMDLSNLFGSKEQGARNKTLTVEHVAEPLYLALQALPSLTAPTRNDVLSVASAYYGGSVAYHLTHKYDLRPVIERWAKDEDSQALESPLARNQQLADILLSETPWMVEAQQQKASRQRLVSLLDEMEQEQRRMTMLAALSARQHSDGSFGWFPGMSGSVWMTGEVATLLVRLGAIKGEWTVPERQILDKAMTFLAKEMHEDVEALRKEKNPTLSFSQLRYLYIYIMCKEGPLPTSPEGEETSRYLLSLLKKQAGGSSPLWEDREALELRALAAIVLKRAGEEKKAQALMPRIHELLNHMDGAYLAYPGGSFTSINRKVETHVTLMEAVQTVEPKETDLLARMAEWLIQQKRTQEWEQPVQSADAVYALTASTSDLSPEDGSKGSWSGTVTYDGQTRKLQAQQPFAAYVRERIDPIAKPKELRIAQQTLPQGGSRDGAVLSWGSVIAQYQIPAGQAESHSEGMTIRRETEMVNGKWSMGKCVVRYTITADRDYEYVCLRAPRPATAEPARQLSGYRWQNGLGYYQAIRDASTEYFMDRLPRGTYVIEEEWSLSRSGSFLLPPARLTCLYAPEFQSQTAGETFSVK